MKNKITFKLLSSVLKLMMAVIMIMSFAVAKSKKGSSLKIEPAAPKTAPVKGNAPSKTAPKSGGVNLIEDGGFESGNLDQFSTEGAEIVKTGAKYGSYAVKISGSDGYVAFDVTDMIEANVEYIFIAWINVLVKGNSWGTPTMRLSKYDKLGTGDFFKDIKAKNDAAKGYQLIKAVYTFTEEDLSVDKLLFGVKNFGYQGEALIDGLVIVPKAVYDAKVSKTIKKSEHTEGSLFEGGGFEMGVEGDFFLADGKVVEGKAHDGKYCVELTGGGGAVSMSVADKLTPGTEYEITLYVKVTQSGGSWGAPRLTGSVYRDCGTDEYKSVRAKDDPNEEWQKLTLNFTASEENLTGDVHFGIRNFGFPGVCLVDDISIKEKK